MAKMTLVKAKRAVELARVLGLSKTDAVEWSVRSQLNDKIINAVRDSGLSHVQVAKAARTSRTRLTAILNRNTSHVSTDLVLRILTALGYRPKITFVRTHPAA